jgi:hypothetical protein
VLTEDVAEHPPQQGGVLGDQDALSGGRLHSLCWSAAGRLG